MAQDKKQTKADSLIHSFEGESCKNFNGLTKREYFTAMAMQGISSNSVLTDAFLQDAKITKEGVSVYARNAVELADALIAALNKTP